jgi:hypothetical protein
VSAGELDLLAIARAMVSPEPDASVDASLAAEVKIEKLSPAAMAVLEDTLAKGTVRMLARLGGARAVVRADTGNAKPSRAFDVRPVPVLAFSKYTYELLRWLTKTPLGLGGAPTFGKAPATIGDELCAYFTFRLVVGRRFEPVVAANVYGTLAGLGFPRSYARWGTDPRVPDFASFLSTAEARLAVECLRDDLASRWLASTTWSAKELLDLDVASRVGSHERQTLDAFLDVCAKKERWDLASFLVDAALAALPPGVRIDSAAARAQAPVRSGGTLRARTEARKGAGALYHVLPRLARQYEEQSLVRFIDDGYDVAQALLTSWAPLGREGFARASAVVSELSSIAAFVPAAAENQS